MQYYIEHMGNDIYDHENHDQESYLEKENILKNKKQKNQQELT